MKTAKIFKDGAWKKTIPLVYTNGAWKIADKVYVYHGDKLLTSDGYALLDSSGKRLEGDIVWQ